jgi:hypothetical protein
MRREKETAMSNISGTIAKVIPAWEQKKYSDAGNRTRICPVRADRASHYTTSEIIDFLPAQEFLYTKEK